METNKKFTEELIQHYLYGYKDMRLASSEEVISTLSKGHVRKSSSLPETPPLSPRKIRTPDEISLCSSSLPGCKFGACSIKRIQHGTWFGPFEGKLVRTTEVAGMTTDYMWEIFHDGEVSHFLDGFNENNWMAFVRCARYKKEQNLVVFQYHGCIYYRSTKDILPGNELLVWYDSKYTQLLGIPLTWNDSRGTTKRKSSLSINTDDPPKKKREKIAPLSLLQRIDYKSSPPIRKNELDLYATFASSKTYDMSPSNIGAAPTTAPLRCDKCFFSFHTKDQLLTHKCLNSPWLPPSLRIPSSLEKPQPFHRPVHVNTPFSDAYYQNYYHNLSYAYPSPPMEHIKHYNANGPHHPHKSAPIAIKNF